jgi:hypothetical protein
MDDPGVMLSGRAAALDCWILRVLQRWSVLSDEFRARLQSARLVDDAELEIVGATSAQGTDAGCVIWKCVTETGQTFDVVPAWPDDERRDALANAGSFICCMLSVRFRGRTAAGVPRCASGIAVHAAGCLTQPPKPATLLTSSNRPQQSERRS